MAKIDISWTVAGPLSVYDEARDLGFDIRKFDRQDEEVQSAVRKASIDRIMKKIRNEWDSNSSKHSFSDVKNGVYVISISDGFGVQYKGGESEVMYIGRGAISNRLRSHLHNWIFDMSRSLMDVSFKFYMTTVGDGRSVESFKDLEHYMLDDFHRRFEEKPLLNKVAGREGHIDHEFVGSWSKPFDNRGKSYLWSIRPTPKNDWFKTFDD